MRSLNMNSIICLLLGAFAVSGCASIAVAPDTTAPAFYESMAKPDARLNAAAAASLFSDYRVKNGLPPVQIDPKLNAMAEAQARAMAQRNQLTHDPGGRGFVQRLQASGFDARTGSENIGAGYHTLAEAFSGWRDSPSHNKNMLMPGATKIGIAAVYSAKSKYKVFWALVLAEPDGPG